MNSQAPKRSIREVREGMAQPVFSLDHALELLSGRRDAWLQWLRDRNLVCQGPTGPQVIWPDVLDALRATTGQPTTAKTSARGRVCLPMVED